MEGKINEKRGRERPRDTNLGNTKKLLFIPSYEAMKRLARKREKWLQRQSEVFRYKKNISIVN